MFYQVLNESFIGIAGSFVVTWLEFDMGYNFLPYFLYTDISPAGISSVLP